MSSASIGSTSDLKTSARILTAAIDCIAARGFVGSTIREIAEACAVSPALVIHHFGSKEGLRKACNRRVVEFVREKGRADSSRTGRLDAVFVRYGAYAARALAEDSEEARELFDALLEESRAVVADASHSGQFRVSSDPEAQALALIVLGLAPFMVAAQLPRWAHTDLESAMARLAVPIAEIYTHGLVADSGLLGAAITSRKMHS